VAFCVEFLEISFWPNQVANAAATQYTTHPGTPGRSNGAIALTTAALLFGKHEITVVYNGATIDIITHYEGDLGHFPIGQSSWTRRDFTSVKQPQTRQRKPV
jgi:hypothetical protein